MCTPGQDLLLLLFRTQPPTPFFSAGVDLFVCNGGDELVCGLAETPRPLRLMKTAPRARTHTWECHVPRAHLLTPSTGVGSSMPTSIYDGAKQHASRMNKHFIPPATSCLFLFPHPSPRRQHPRTCKNNPLTYSRHISEQILRLLCLGLSERER